MKLNMTTVSEFVSENTQFSFYMQEEVIPLAVYPGHIKTPKEFKGAMAAWYGSARSGDDGCTTVIFRECVYVPYYRGTLPVVYKWNGEGYTAEVGTPTSRFDIYRSFAATGYTPLDVTRTLIKSVRHFNALIESAKPWAWQSGNTPEFGDYLLLEDGEIKRGYHSLEGEGFKDVKWLPCPFASYVGVLDRNDRGFFINWRSSDILPDAPCWCVVTTNSYYDNRDVITTPTMVVWFDGAHFNTEGEVSNWLALPD